MCFIQMEKASDKKEESSRPLRVLIVEDSEDDAELLLRMLRRGGYAPESARVERSETMIGELGNGGWDIVLSDYSMPGFSGMEALKLLRSEEGEQGDLPFIILSGTIGEEIAVEVMKAGANDYIMKNNMTRLIPAIERELREYISRKNERKMQIELQEKEEEIKVARIIQQGLFPSHSIELEKFDIGGRSYPTDATGGDYYDYFTLPDGRIGIIIGDVSGHGLGPALLMAATRAYIRAFLKHTTDVGVILENTNRVLYEDVEDGNRFVTLVLGILDPRDSSFIYSSAGHQYGYILDVEGKVKHEVVSTGLPLGVFQDIDYPSSEKIPLAENDIVLLLTDGINEAVPVGKSNHDVTFGVERPLEIVHDNRKLSSANIVETLHKEVLEYSDHYQEDDITAVVVKVF